MKVNIHTAPLILLGTALVASCALSGCAHSKSPSPNVANPAPGTKATSQQDSDWSRNRAAEAKVTSAAADGAPIVTAEPRNGQVELTWTPVPYADTYNIYRSLRAGDHSSEPIKRGIDTQPLLDESLANGTTYYYQVAGVSKGKELARSAEVAISPRDFSAPQSDVSSSDAIAIANAFSSKAGLVATGTPNAIYPYQEFKGSVARIPEHYYLPRWSVQYPSGLSIEVAAQSRQVVAMRAMGSYGDKAAGTAIPQTKAIELAHQIVEAASLKSAVNSSPTCQEMQIASPPKADTHMWMIRYPRITTDNVPFRDDDVSIMLMAETGKMKIMSANFHTAEPPITNRNVTTNLALTTAKQTLDSLKLTPVGAIPAPTEMVVQPNSFPAQRTSIDEKRGAPRYAWVCMFPIQQGRVEVWIDVETGKVIGGETAYLK